MKRQPKHHCCWPGKTVRIVMRDGTVLYGKFVEERSAYITVNIGNHTTNLKKKELASFGIDRRFMRASV